MNPPDVHSPFFDPMFDTPEMAAIFSDEARFQRMLDFDAALARAEARLGIIPESAAASIAEKCRVELFDVPRLIEDAAAAGTPVVPLVHRLAELVPEEARSFVHFGATSQDAIDTGSMLQMQAGLDVMVDVLMGIAGECADLADNHRHSLMPGRTLLQHAVPITFGLKAAQWLDLVLRCVTRLRGARDGELFLQFGGAAGTLASLGTKGPSVADSLGKELGLTVPDRPWHSSRDHVVAVSATVVIAAGAAAKIATDVVLLMQPEVGEVASSTGMGASSAMPQKRNPVDAITAISASRLAAGSGAVILSSMVQEHERAAGAWQSEWKALPDLFRTAGRAAASVRRLVENLTVDNERMRANLELAGGSIMAEALRMALLPKTSREEADALIRQVLDDTAGRRIDLSAAAAQNETLAGILGSGLEEVLDPAFYLGDVEGSIDRALDRFRGIAGRG